MKEWEKGWIKRAKSFVYGKDQKNYYLNYSTSIIKL